MINNKWFCETDRFRESWCFIIFVINKKKNKYKIASWKLGYGNPGQLTRKLQSKKKKESKIIESILGELNYCRKNNVRIITINKKDIKILRTRCIQLDIQNTSLQGINPLHLDTLLRRYFDLGDDESTSFENIVTSIGFNNSKETEPDQLRRIMEKIGPFIPMEVFDEGQS